MLAAFAVGWLAIVQAVAGPANPFVGEWIINLTASTPHPSYPLRTATLQVSMSGDAVTMASDVVLTSGKRHQATETFHVDGQEHAFPQSPIGSAVVVAARWIGPRVLETIARNNGEELAVATYEVSADGKTLTAKTSGKAAPEQVIVYDRKYEGRR